MPSTRRTVITGMGVVSPNGTGVPAFTSAVLEGRSGVRRISRFDASPIEVQIAGEVSDFDELAWVERKDRKHVSRVLPLALCAATEALSSAELNSASLPIEQRRRFGVIIGTGGGSQEFTEEQYRLYFHGQLSKMSLFCVPTGVMGSISSELNVRFGLRGPSHVITTGCTSSTDAMAYAMRQIQSGRLDIVLTGGADAPISLGTVRGFILMKILTESWNAHPERGSRPFSADRDGFVLAEGAWMFVDYVNLHGTSTQLNDRIETRALKLALGEERARAVPMSALKSQIGHPQGACGAAGVAATLVAMQNAQIPPTINLDDPDKDCDLDYVPEPGRKKNIEHAVCNCIALGSKNSALVLRKIA